MDPAPDDAGILLVVTLKRAAEQVAQIASILGRLEIRTEALRANTLDPDPGTVTVRIPPDRVMEAVLALTYHGFSEVRAYATDTAGPPR